MLERQIGEGGIAAEIGVAALVDPEGKVDVSDEVFDEEMSFDIGPPGAGVGKFCVFYEFEGLLAGGVAVLTGVIAESVAGNGEAEE